MFQKGSTVKKNKKRLLNDEQRLNCSQGFERLGASLVDGNAWAKEAAVLMLSVARTSGAFHHLF